MTSGINKYTTTGYEIVNDAFRHLRVLQAGQSLDASDRELGRRYLNNLLKSWQADGLHVWKDTEAALFMTIGKAQYDLGESGGFGDGSCTPTGHVGDVYATNGDWVGTETTADVAAGTSVIPLKSLTTYRGVTWTTSTDDLIGVENENGELEWFNILSSTNLNVTIDGTLSADVLEGDRVFIYLEELDKPLKVYQDNVRLYQQSGNEQTIQLLDWSDYNNGLPNKTTPGTTVQVYYQPKLTTGTMAVWPPTDTVKDAVLFRYQAPIDIFDAGTEASDFPAEWIIALGWGLAAELALSYGTPDNRIAYIEAKADEKKQEVLDWDQTNASIFLVPDYDWRGDE